VKDKQLSADSAA